MRPEQLLKPLASHRLPASGYLKVGAPIGVWDGPRKISFSATVHELRRASTSFDELRVAEGPVAEGPVPEGPVPEGYCQLIRFGIPEGVPLK
jgi:hypothetical protein